MCLNSSTKLSLDHWPMSLTLFWFCQLNKCKCKQLAVRCQILLFFSYCLSRHFLSSPPPVMEVSVEGNLTFVHYLPLPQLHRWHTSPALISATTPTKLFTLEVLNKGILNHINLVSEYRVSCRNSQREHWAETHPGSDSPSQGPHMHTQTLI